MARRKPEDLDKEIIEEPTPNNRTGWDEPKTKVISSKSNKRDSIVVPADKGSVSKKVTVELEVDTSVKDLGVNPYAKWIHLARAFDQWRIFPRIFISVYIYLLYHVVFWYMNLDGPSTEQSGLVSVVVGAGAAWFGLYTGSSKSR